MEYAVRNLRDASILPLGDLSSVSLNDNAITLQVRSTTVTVFTPRYSLPLSPAVLRDPENTGTYVHQRHTRPSSYTDCNLVHCKFRSTIKVLQGRKRRQTQACSTHVCIERLKDHREVPRVATKCRCCHCIYQPRQRAEEKESVRRSEKKDSRSDWRHANRKELRSSEP